MSTVLNRSMNGHLVWTCSVCHGEHTVLLAPGPSNVCGGAVFTVEQTVIESRPKDIVTDIIYRLSSPVDLTGCLSLPSPSATHRMSLGDRIALHKAVGNVILDPDERDALYRVLEREGLA